MSMYRAPLLAALLLASPFALASGALAVANDLHLLIADTTMVMIEVDPETHAGKAREIMDRLDSTLPPVITRVAAGDAARAADLATQWDDLKSAYEGEPFAVAFRESSYDTNLTARYTAGSDALLMALDAPAWAEAAGSATASLRLNVLRTVTSYLRISTGIVGGTSFSANDQSNDIPSGVATVDQGFAALKRQYAGKPQAAELQRITARWSFLRPALLKQSNQSAPFIVYTHGLAVASAVAALDKPSAP